MANPLTIVQQFQQALGKGDFTAARHLLHDNLSFGVQSIHFTSQSRIWKRSKNSNPLPNELIFSGCSQTEMMYVCCAIWLQTLPSAPRLFANGITSRARRSRTSGSCSTRVHSLRCSRSRQDEVLPPLPECRSLIPGQQQPRVVSEEQGPARATGARPARPCNGSR